MVWLPDGKKYLYLVPFFSYLTLNNIVTSKSGLEVTQGHSNWYHLLLLLLSNRYHVETSERRSWEPRSSFFR